MTAERALYKVIEELQDAIYRGHKIKDELAHDNITLAPAVEAKLDGTMEGYSQAIGIIRAFLGHEGESHDHLQ